MYARVRNWLWPQPPSHKIFISGLDGVGKTTLLYKMKLGEIVTTIPTIGFNVESITHKGIEITSWDMGGCGKIRPLFKHYFKDIEAVIYVVDSNDPDRLGVSLEELKIIVDDTEGAAGFSALEFPVLVFANKQDLPKAMTPGEVKEKMQLDEALRKHPWHMVGCSFHDGDGMYEGLDWLVDKLTEMKDVKSQPSRKPQQQAPESKATPSSPIGPSCTGPPSNTPQIDIQQRLKEWMAVEDESDDEFLEKLTNYTLDTWDHRTHLRIAWLHMIRYGRRAGLKLIFQRIQNFINHSPITRKLGAAGSGKGATFHVTMTYFWSHMVHHAIAMSSRAHDFKDFLTSNPHLADGGLFLNYYSKEVMLMRPESRLTMVLPDIKPLPNVLYDTANSAEWVNKLVNR